MKTLKRNITRLNQIQRMNQVKEKGGEGGFTMKTKNTKKDHLVTTGVKAKSKTIKMLITEGRIVMKTENTEKDHPVTTGVKEKSMTIKKMLMTEGRITMKTGNTEKDHPVTTRVKAKSKTIKKTLMTETITETITSQSQEDMLQKVSPILMFLKGGMGAFENQALLDLLLLRLSDSHAISGEMWLLSFQKKRGLLNLGRWNLLLSCMKGRDGNV